MTAGRPHPTIDELLDAYVAAWHAGEAPSSAAFAERAAADERDELAGLIAAFLELAPTVQPTPTRSAELAADPLVERIAALEGERWERLDAAAAKAGVGSDAGAEAGAGSHAGAGARSDAGAAAHAASDAAAAAQVGAGAGDQSDIAARVEAEAEFDGAAGAPWGARLRTLREAAGLSVGDLAGRFAERFGLRGDDVGAAPAALSALEAGELPPTGVAARAARALEELLGASKGVLVAGAAPAFGGPLLRGALPEGAEERDRFADLLRDVDDALAIEADVHEGEAESLSDLLGS